MSYFLITTLVILLGGLVGFSVTHWNCRRNNGSTSFNENVALVSIFLVALGIIFLLTVGLLAFL